MASKNDWSDFWGPQLQEPNRPRYGGNMEPYSIFGRSMYEQEMLRQRREMEALIPPRPLVSELSMSQYWRNVLEGGSVSNIPKTKTWLQNAQEITEGDRRKAYGHPLPNFLRAAIAFTPILGHPITPLQVAELQVAWKVVRDVNTYKDDNWIDTIGYSNTVQMMDNRMKEMRYSGIDYFRVFTGAALAGELYAVLEKHEKQFPKGE